jgi:hypothetical protein
VPAAAGGFKLTPGSGSGPLTLSVALPMTEGSSDFIGSLVSFAEELMF